MKAADRVVVNTGILYARMGVTIFFSLYTTRVLLATLGVNDFGIFNLVGGAIAMLTFLNTAMTAATQRFISYAEGAGDKERQKSIFNVSVVLHLLIAVIIAIILEVVGYFLFDGVFKIPVDRIYGAKIVYQFMIVSTVFTIISVPYDAVINAHENMLLYAILGVIESVLKLVIAVYLIHTSYDRLIAYGLLTALLSIVLLLIRRFYCRAKYKECEINLKRYYKKSTFKELSNFAGWSFLGTSTSMLTNYGQGVVMNSFFGPIVNTAQGIANQVSGQLGVFAGTMQKALNPVIGKSEGAGDRTLMLRASTMGSKVSFFLLMLFFIPVLIDIPYIFGVWLKKVPEYVVVFCRLLLIRNLVEQLFTTLSVAIAAVGNIKKYQIYRSLVNIIPLILSYFLFSLHYPAYTIYLVFLGYSLMNGVVLLYFAKKVCGLSISDYMKNVVGRCVLLFLLILSLASIPVFVMDEGFKRLIFILFLNTVFFFIGTWFIGFSGEERKPVYNLISNLMIKLKLKRKLA
ncbi:O-antigen/teichoic acid export membrane protein [Filimonas zeae]|uniref:Na+-driven multidrug efflux pump n=1 Tax=Filimonas zeae TaxID=1737353 RepID=A0A917IL34_9BACT|nr:MATE family efflux transporter [Filimonas zeae]MDR6336990.1 O-antigen/teichoic acid export membrane protein [Filimonas zeae]GGH56486.1 hypothetical protein GCM10011379_00120 [Filimonas zeae]